MSAEPAEFRERFTVPVRWWLVVLFFVASVFVAVGFYLGPVNGLVVTGLCAAVVAAVLVPYGALLVRVDDQALTVGPNRIAWEWVGGAQALDAEAARQRLGAGADARGYLIVRPYLREAVEVTLADSADPHPYWLVGSRQARELAAAINSRVGAPDTAEERTNAES